jgi:uncharacterized protein
MPLLASTYRSYPALSNPHLQTIFPTLFRHRPRLALTKERLELPDGDFLDLEWNRRPTQQALAILTHGLEGSSHAVYMRCMARALLSEGFDVLLWNLRGCSGEPNRLPHAYHSGKSEDLRYVIAHALTTTSYRKIALIGFSIGGNITLKYLGEEGSTLSPRIQAAISLSAPLDLKSSAEELAKPHNKIYLFRFLHTLKAAIREKSRRFPDKLSAQNLSAIRNFYDFDTQYTAPLHGFASAEDYWEKASSLPLLNSIKCPALLISAQDDPFLSKESFPTSLANSHPHLFLDSPDHGGHVGFLSSPLGKLYWSERRTLAFLAEVGLMKCAR